MSVLPSHFDASKIAFGEIRTLSSGSKAANVSYNGGPLVIQVNNLDLPYGLNSDDKFGPVKYSINLSLTGYDSNPKVKELYDALDSLDNRVMSECVEKNWLRKPGMTQQILKQMKLYKPSVKFSEDPNTGVRKPYPPTLKVALRQKNGKFETTFYDSDRKEIKNVPIEDLVVKRMTVMALIECTSVWVSSVGCGLSWKATQVKVVSRPDGPRGYGFIEDDGEARQMRAGQSAAGGSKAAFAAAFDEEEEDEAEVEEEEVFKAAAPAPMRAAEPAELPEDHAPASVPKKKVIQKKTVGKPA